MKKLWIAILIVFFAAFSAAQSTGAAPGFQNLGTVQPGQNQIVNFYVTSSGYENPYAVTASSEEPLSSRMLDPAESPVDVNEYSEEEIASWMDFTQNEYVVTPTNTTPYVLENGQTIDAGGRIRMYLRVPQNAEPGWHAGAISLNPQIDREAGGGFGAATVQGLTQPTFAFRVPGNAERRLEVVDARGVRTSDDSARIDLRIANRGSVTTSMRGADIDVYNRDTGEKAGDLTIGYHEFEPQRSQVVSTTLGSGVEQGSFQMNGSIDYWSSQAFVDGQTFALSSQVQNNPSEPEDFGGDGNPQGDNRTPAWLPLLFILVVAVVLYSFGFDIFWIMVIVGFLAIALFIILSPVSNWLLLILLTAPVITFIYA
jgi:hypothetical protein